MGLTSGRDPKKSSNAPMWGTHVFSMCHVLATSVLMWHKGLRFLRVWVPSNHSRRAIVVAIPPSLQHGARALSGPVGCRVNHRKAAGPVDSGASTGPCRQGLQGGCRQGRLNYNNVFLVSLWEGRPCRQGPVGCRVNGRPRLSINIS